MKMFSQFQQTLQSHLCPFNFNETIPVATWNSVFTFPLHSVCCVIYIQIKVKCLPIIMKAGQLEYVYYG